jgi:lysozyme
MMEHGVNNMEISQEGISLIKKFEGCRLESYKCAAGVWTIGYGSTHGVSEGMVITHERAEALLLEDIADYEDAVNELITVPLSSNQFSAIVAWCFNCGKNALKTSTLRKVLLAKDYEGVPEQIKRWNKAGGKVNEGLVRRREAEALLFQGQDWSHV